MTKVMLFREDHFRTAEALDILYYHEHPLVAGSLIEFRSILPQVEICRGCRRR